MVKKFEILHKFYLPKPKIGIFLNNYNFKKLKRTFYKVDLPFIIAENKSNLGCILTEKIHFEVRVIICKFMQNYAILRKSTYKKNFFLVKLIQG